MQITIRSIDYSPRALYQREIIFRPTLTQWWDAVGKYIYG